MNNPENDHRSGYVPALDGIRGLAIILVIVSHFFFTIGIFKAGWIGVDLFFVLSGYLIASKFIKVPLSGKLVRTFFRNRALRILPLYFLFIGVIFLLSALLPDNKQVLLYLPNLHFFWQHHLLLMQNWMYVVSSTSAGLYSPLFHLWSVAVEEQFYLLFPLIILLMTRIKGKVLFILLGIVLIGVLRSVDYTIFHDSYSVYRYYCNTLFRLDAFLAGILLAIIFREVNDSRRLELPFLGLFLLCFGLCVFNAFYFNSVSNDTPFINTAGYSVIALMFMTLLYFVVMRRSTVLNAVFTNRFLVFSGKISYGLYLFHFAVDFFSSSVLHKYFNFLTALFNEKAATVIFSMIMIAMLYLISYISYVSFERFFLKMKKKY